MPHGCNTRITLASNEIGHSCLNPMELAMYSMGHLTLMSAPSMSAVETGTVHARKLPETTEEKIDDL